MKKEFVIIVHLQSINKRWKKYLDKNNITYSSSKKY